MCDDQYPPSNYYSLDAKVVAYAPILTDANASPNHPAIAITLLEEKGHFCESFHTNMVAVWHILYGMFGQIPVWIHAAPTKKEKNGCKLFHLLFDHYRTDRGIRNTGG